MNNFLQAKIFLLSEIIPNVLWADLMDILIITVLIYWLVRLFKKTRSSFVFLGIALLGLIYFLAKILNLGLTLIIFRAFFSVILIGLVVIFQKEIRQFLEIVVSELFALWGKGRRGKQKLTAPEYVENIVHVAERLAQQKIGMLVVLTGHQPLNNYIQGGFDLNGKISEPLLQSIFDPSTPGHDGAVLIEGDIITKFAAHLPLSEDFQQIKQYGTRHSAGLGIAEKTDALSIIVSEERGAISVGRNGKLKSVIEVAQLEHEIESFLLEKFVQKPKADFLNSNAQDKILSLLMALALWYLLVYQLR